MNGGSLKWALIFAAISGATNVLVIVARDGQKSLAERFRDNWRDLAAGVFFFGLIGAVVGFDGTSK